MEYHLFWFKQYRAGGYDDKFSLKKFSDRSHLSYYPTGIGTYCRNADRISILFPNYGQSYKMSARSESSVKSGFRFSLGSCFLPGASNRVLLKSSTVSNTAIWHNESLVQICFQCSVADRTCVLCMIRKIDQVAPRLLSWSWAIHSDPPSDFTVDDVDQNRLFWQKISWRSCMVRGTQHTVQ